MADLYVIKPAPGEVVGSAGDDRLYSGKAADRVDGQSGIDTFVTGIPFARSGFRPVEGAAALTWMVGDDTLVNVEFIQFGDVLVRLDDPVLQQLTQHLMTDYADVLIGNDLGYVLEGWGGDDTLIGNGGDDTLYGGKGNDTAVYRGNRADYVIGYDMATQLFFVRDQVSGRDGNDVLGSSLTNNMELLRFADGEIALESFRPAPVPVPAPAPVPRQSGTSGADQMIGTELGEVFDASDGNDVLFGNGGGDSLYGGKGHDTAVYRGGRADYLIGYDTLSGQFSVRDQVSGRDGSDILTDVETLQFADGSIALDLLRATVPLLPAELVARGVGQSYGIGWVTSAAYELGAEAWSFESVRAGLVPSGGVVSLTSDLSGTGLGLPGQATFVVDESIELVGLSHQRLWMPLDRFCEP